METRQIGVALFSEFRLSDTVEDEVKKAFRRLKDNSRQKGLILQIYIQKKSNCRQLVLGKWNIYTQRFVWRLAWPWTNPPQDPQAPLRFAHRDFIKDPVALSSSLVTQVSFRKKLVIISKFWSRSLIQWATNFSWFWPFGCLSNLPVQWLIVFWGLVDFGYLGFPQCWNYFYLTRSVLGNRGCHCFLCVSLVIEFMGRYETWFFL